MDTPTDHSPAHELHGLSLATHPPSISSGHGSASTAVPSPTTKKKALVLLSSFLMIFNVIGVNQTYGIFQEFYASPHHSPLPPSQISNHAAIAFVGTLGAGLTWGGSIFVNPLVGRVRDVRWITGLGSLGMSLGLVLAGQSRNVRARK
jgi:hypothetical protein